MAGALAAYYRKIPVDHVEAGLRSGNIYHPWPEEVNRKIIGTIASLHFAPTDVSASALLAENVDPADRVHVTGNTVIDALHWVTARIAAEPRWRKGLAELEARFAGKRIIGVTSHRRENFGGGMEGIAEAIRQIAARPDVAVIFPVHLNPNVRKVMDAALGGAGQRRDDRTARLSALRPVDRDLDIMLTDRAGCRKKRPRWASRCW
jgi:UDP-N-acetylglucosamine 2-epimerase (non-hydrolysing)